MPKNGFTIKQEKAAIICHLNIDFTTTSHGINPIWLSHNLAFHFGLYPTQVRTDAFEMNQVFGRRERTVT